MKPAEHSIINNAEGYKIQTISRKILFGFELFALILAPFFSLCGFLISNQLEGTSTYFSSYVAIYIWISLVFIRVYKGSSPLDFLSPALGLISLLFMYSVASALYVEREGITPLGAVINRYYFNCILGLLGIAIGTLMAQLSHTPFFKWCFRINDFALFKKLIFYGVLSTIILFPFISHSFNFLSVQSYAERALASRIEYMASPYSGVTKTFLVDLPVTLILCAALLLIVRHRSLLAKSTGAIIFLAFIVTNIMAGWRGVVVSAAIIPLVFYHYRIKRIGIVTVFVCGIVLYLFMSVMSLVRSTSDPAKMWDILSDNISNRGLQFAKFEASGELIVGINLMQLISGIEDGDTEYTYGTSAITELLVFIPRAVYPGRPLPLADKFTDVFYPGDREAGAGYGLFFLQEGYWAFGEAGVFLFMFFYGWSVQVVYQWFIRNMHYDITALLYSLIYPPLVLYAVRSGLIGNYRIALMRALPLIVISLLPVITWKRKNLS